MDSLIIMPDMNITLEIPSFLSPEGNLRLSSAVEEVLEDDCLLIKAPAYKERVYYLPSNTPILMVLLENSSRHILPVQFVKNVIQNNVVFTQVRRLGDVEQHQRRDCYRLPMSAPLMIERVPPDGEEYPPDSPAFEGRTVNLSDAGMCFNTNEEFHEGEKLLLTLNIGTEEVIGAEVIRSESSPHLKYELRTAVKLSHMDDFQERRFYKFIVDKQNEARRRELGNTKRRST